jgi:hypothetical protein
MDRPPHTKVDLTDEGTSAKTNATLAMTPTTAAVIPVSAADSAVLPRRRSTKGAP